MCSHAPPSFLLIHHRVLLQYRRRAINPTRTLAGRFCCKERLKHLIVYFLGDAVAVIFYRY